MGNNPPPATGAADTEITATEWEMLEDWLHSGWDEHPPAAALHQAISAAIEFDEDEKWEESEERWRFAAKEARALGFEGVTRPR